ncbi:MAG: ABC transporter substrate-binding protein [Pseudomonadales bacterium]|nr:ABC transporter substrate-binding protein [Pseudomonadales bacterium]
MPLSANQNDPLLGRKINNAYEIVKPLASGGMSVVYLANQLSLNRNVVLKVLRPSLNDEDFINLFLREARIISQLNHPNVVGVFDFGKTPEDGIVYLAMEYLEGEDLEVIVKQKGGIALAQIMWVIEQLCNGVHAAHKLNIVHRDLKPNNVMVSRLAGDTTAIKILDFGISKPLSEEDLKHTRLGMIMGTAGYLAPEQIEGRLDIDTRADIYALGAIIYFMATGKKPYSGASREIIMGRQISEPPPKLDPMSVKDTDVLVLQQVINKAMAKDRDDRYASVKDLWADVLNHAQQYQKVAVSQTTHTESQNLETVVLDRDQQCQYRFVFNSEIEADKSVQDVRQALQDAMNFSDKQLNALFTGKRVIVRKNLALQSAQRIERQFKRCGALGKIEEMEEATRVKPGGRKANEGPDVTKNSLPTAELLQPISAAEVTRVQELVRAEDVNTPEERLNPEDVLSVTQRPTHIRPRKKRLPWLGWAVTALLLLGPVLYYSPVNRYEIMDLWMVHVNKFQSPRGVESDRIRLAMSAPFRGSAREIGRSMRIGIESYIEHVNENGGVNGRLIELMAANDNYEPEKAQENIEVFIHPDAGAFALLGAVGTPTTKSILPITLKNRMIVFGSFSGASFLRKSPPDRYVFNYRASYFEETAAIVQHYTKIKNIDPNKIAVFYQNDSYGQDGLQGVIQALNRAGVAPETVIKAAYERNSSNIFDAAELFTSRIEEIEALIIIGTYSASAEFTVHMRQNGFSGEIANVSFVGSRALAEKLLEYGPEFTDKILVTQVVPHYDSYATGMLLYRESLKKYFPNEETDFISAEGFIAARIFIEALDSVGRYFDAEDVANLLESISGHDIGIGTEIGFSPSNHQASNRVWGTVLNQKGQFEEIDLNAP